jgi:hypothetical protein
MSPVDFEIWLSHFRHHAEHRRCVPSGLPDVLRPVERRLIGNPIATFDLGDEAESRTLLRAATRLAERRCTPALVPIAGLIIGEKQHQAALLRRFMRDHLIALQAPGWTNRLFREVRRLAGPEIYLYVLVSADLIGIVYHRALEAATNCERLRSLCRAFVSDELVHVGFESQLILALRADRAGPLQSLMRLAHRTSFAATAGAVWLTRRSVLRRAGHDARSFLRACLAQHAFYLDPVVVAPALNSSPTSGRVP